MINCQVTEFLGAGARQFAFMLRGLRELEPKLEDMGIRFFLAQGNPVDTIPKLVKDTKVQSPLPLLTLTWEAKLQTLLDPKLMNFLWCNLLQSEHQKHFI
jgi:deoxyribodipyrimidine photolyase